MDAETLTALKRSIEKWERNAVAETPYDIQMGVLSCPLCQLFWRWGCTGCPAMHRTGESGCFGSPYAEAAVAADKWLDNPGNENRRAAAHAAARDEVTFLRSLLPEEEPTP